MKLERTRAAELAKILRRDAPAAGNTAKAIETQLRKTQDAYIFVPDAWIKSNASASVAIREFASNLNGSSFEGFRPAPPPRNAFSELPPFETAKSWDLDSTPEFLRRLSRFLGTRPPDVEAAIVMASLKHDIRYYYGGDMKRKVETDRMFAEEIQQYGKLLGSNETLSSVVASVDRFAVGVGGGAPFQESYSWSFGVPKEQRNYAALAPGHTEQVDAHAEKQMLDVLRKISSESYAFNAEQQRILTPEIRRHLKDLATKLLAQRESKG